MLAGVRRQDAEFAAALFPHAERVYKLWCTFFVSDPQKVSWTRFALQGSLRTASTSTLSFSNVLLSISYDSKLSPRTELLLISPTV